MNDSINYTLLTNLTRKALKLYLDEYMKFVIPESLPAFIAMHQLYYVLHYDLPDNIL